MKFIPQKCLLLIASLSLFAGCASDYSPLLATDDCGPKPTNYREIVAAWFNSHYSYTPPTPVRPDEFSITEPTKVATTDLLLGRIVGWQVILGPENEFVTKFTDSFYTRLVIHRGRVVSETGSGVPFSVNH